MRIDHDREWIIGCIKHDGFIKTDRFDKANQIILEALSADLGKEFCTEEEIAELERQAEIFADYAKKKRRWENAFQKWSNYMGLDEGSTEGYGCCGYGVMCDWCKDNDYGRPCVRALNAMLREKGKKVDYDDTDFVKVWRGW